ncbi:rCG53424 [Rattus norvegicus]|uniref:RCG53424 n=1 Tax=Rattus norvegicus TaxID=10116 RepID=A6JRL7_RAT|nr:rCG53424 [Rattus norvegicus]
MSWKWSRHWQRPWYRQTLQDLTSVETCTKEDARMCPAHVKSKECQLC